MAVRMDPGRMTPQEQAEAHELLDRPAAERDWRAARRALRQRPGLSMVQAAAAISACSGEGRRCCWRLASTTRARRWTSIWGMSMATGQTS